MLEIPPPQNHTVNIGGSAACGGGMVQAVGLPGSVAGVRHTVRVPPPQVWACMCAGSRRATHVRQGTERPRHEIQTPAWCNILKKIFICILDIIHKCVFLLIGKELLKYVKMQSGIDLK